VPSDHTQRFEGGAAEYANFRPAYPDALLHWLGRAILAPEGPPDGLIVDVGCGTGIFTRQLLTVLPADLSVLGVEPSPDMRSKAEAAGPFRNAAYVAGTAEALPVADGAARAVVAATAAHWFDRPAFFIDAARALKPGGLLAIIEYVRDERDSPAARWVVDFLVRHGGARAYDRPDYAAELAAAPEYRDLAFCSTPVTLRLTREAFFGLALSSSHARAAIEALGRRGAESLLGVEADRLAWGDGFIPFGYIFQGFAARRV
jgi:SAM-dependent methyltransferase